MIVSATFYNLIYSLLHEIFLPSDMLLIVKYIIFAIIILFTVCKKIERIKKQIFHAFLFNIRNYSPEVINIQRREAELNIILPRVNNFDIKQKRHGIFVLLYATNTKQDLGR